MCIGFVRHVFSPSLRPLSVEVVVLLHWERRAQLCPVISFYDGMVFFLMRPLIARDPLSEIMLGDVTVEPWDEKRHYLDYLVRKCVQWSGFICWS